MNKLLQSSEDGLPRGIPVPDFTLLTIDQVAEIFGVSVPTIRKWQRNGTIPFVKINSTLRFRSTDVELLIHERTQESIPDAS